MIKDGRCHNDLVYEQLMSRGFRRSGNEIYRPHCVGCQSCQSIRIATAEFIPSRSQKRVVSKCSHFRLEHADLPDVASYALYERYINERHADGSMFPASEEQYENFLFCHWLDLMFINVYDQEKLIAVAVTDVLPTALSAIYTFFDPDYAHFSLGSYCVQLQIEATQAMGGSYLYLGYQIDGCQKMNYKTKFKPFQRLVRGEWLNFA